MSEPTFEEKLEAALARIEALEKAQHGVGRALVDHQMVIQLLEPVVAMAMMTKRAPQTETSHIRRLNYCEGPDVEFVGVSAHSQKREEPPAIALATPQESQIVTATRNPKR